MAPNLKPLSDEGKAPDGALDSAIHAADPYRRQGTKYLHTQGEGDNGNPTGAVVVPISLATTFQQKTPGKATAPEDPNSFGLGFEYSRTGNPTRGAFERAMAQAENAKYCVAFSSGSAATSAVVHLLQHGDHMLCVDDVYGGTQRYFRRIVHPNMGIDMDFCDMSHPSELVFNKPNNKTTKLLWLESPTNPTLKVTDIAEVAKACQENSCLLAVDNTFCSPYFQTPLNLGADIVVHSVTKYIGGHSDVVMGVVCTNSDDVYSKLRFVQNGVGAVPSPFDCFLAHRGLKTLHVRMEAAARNANAIALFLENHDAVTKVLYPGLKSHPQHDIAAKQQHGFGAMITFYCVGGREQSACILQNLHLFTLAESLGAVESLAECPSLMTHASVPDDQRAILGIDDTLIRLSVGIESCHDLIQDLDNALNSALSTLK
ncbi:Cystathionine gamma [Seminavis robusta]|uniref:cystathionine gamma-lyase n=1 Tax=Seminavis robusta TaxID=568900 RepID=A0A9N8EF14_9STRA|nr:Cystathionine gamma [Seminavis robusta]|eukprot:Sro849_g210490.1 Cystathionine gamma (430) ;mRNA; f:1527-3117